MSVLCCVTFHHCVSCSDYKVGGTALSPTLTVYMLATGPGGPSGAVFTQATSVDPLNSGPRIALSVEQDLLWALLGSHSGLANSPRARAHKITVAKSSDLSWLWEHSLFIQMFCRHCVYKVSCRGINLQFVQP